MAAPIIQITEAAQHQIRALLDNAPENTQALQVSLTKGGCTGFTYQVDFTDSIPSGAEIIEGQFGTLSVVPSAVLYLFGAEMDYQDDDLASRFVFSNPNESARCGCGLSIAF